MEEILHLVRKHDATATVLPSASPLTISIQPENLLEVAKSLHTSPSTYLDQLSCVTGIDNGPEAGTMEVIYHLYSIPHNISLALRIQVSREKPEVESLCPIWKSANWLERETFDMMGIRFINHPDLRRILMPADWEGYPLRKDYSESERYREVKIKY